MDYRQIFDMVRQLQSSLPKGPGMGQAWAIADQLRRELSVEEVAFIYRFQSSDFVAAGAGVPLTGIVNGNININSNADFLWMATAYTADLAGAAQQDSTRIVPNINVKFTNAGTGRQYQDNFVPLPSIAGTGRLPFILQVPILLGAKTTLQVDLQSFEAVNTPQIRIQLIGKQLFNLGSGS